MADTVRDVAEEQRRLRSRTDTLTEDLDEVKGLQRETNQRCDRIQLAAQVHEVNDNARDERLRGLLADLKASIDETRGNMWKLMLLLIAALLGIKGLDMAGVGLPVTSAAAGQSSPTADRPAAPTAP